MQPRLAVTAGEPAGIGPDLCVMLAQTPHPAILVVLGDADALMTRARALRLPIEILPIGEHLPTTPAPAGRLYVLETPLATPSVAGSLDPRNAGHVLSLLRRAADGCVAGDYDAMVTAPVHKGVINDAGIPFTGHTEFLAERVGGHPVMMLTCPGLRVALATTHLPLRDVADAITPARLERVITTLDRELRERYSVDRPRILVCGLNPHAGEQGHLGDEEIRVIGPTLDRLRASGLDLVGPLPADTLFSPARLEDADAVLAMYHDQGLPVLKFKGFGQAVNVTLGLPIIRTSVDHGTALDLAATGRIDPGSLQAAVREACRMVEGLRA
jgi:4-hydroxythreonine-4-phosphate dehydrogenase